jgi:hypothetical protein
MDVRIGLKIHKRIETYSQGKLEHLLQLAEIEITNYHRITVNYPPERLAHSKLHLAKLEEQRDIVRKFLLIIPE